MADHPLPPVLADVDPALVAGWTISDDVLRGDAIETASTEDLQRLVAAVPLDVLRAIDDFLDRFGQQRPEDVVWLTDIAQASLEASMELDRRRRR